MSVFISFFCFFFFSSDDFAQGLERWKEKNGHDTRRERRGTAEGNSPCAFGYETPELRLAHVTRIRRWSKRPDGVKRERFMRTTGTTKNWSHGLACKRTDADFLFERQC